MELTVVFNKVHHGLLNFLHIHILLLWTIERFCPGRHILSGPSLDFAFSLKIGGHRPPTLQQLR
jgi:hypothetical protein